jgi:hypothetical protein
MLLFDVTIGLMDGDQIQGSQGLFNNNKDVLGFAISVIYSMLFSFSTFIDFIAF